MVYEWFHFIWFWWYFAGPILVDTVNLSASAGKATAKDIAMVEELSKLCPDLDKDQMYQDLQQAKADIPGKNWALLRHEKIETAVANCLPTK